MRIYTRTGDKGETSLVGGRRVSKDALRIEAYGTVDELNALLGIVASSSRQTTLLKVLERLQNELFVVGADLATPESGPDTESASNGRLEQHAERSIPRISVSHAEGLESLIDRFDAELPPLDSFVLPGGDKVAADLHLARAVCRRAERAVVRLSHSEAVNPQILVYLNRLSDLLFVLARWVNRMKRRKEVRWRKP